MSSQLWRPHHGEKQFIISQEYDVYHFILEDNLENGVEWTGKMEIRKADIPGSKQR